MEQYQTEKEKLQSILFNMNSDRNYWFIRTMSGMFYDEFYQENYVAIGHDGILMRDLQDLSDKEGAAREQLKLKLTEKEPELTPAQRAKAAGQILKFYREAKAGDVVVIPSSNSDKFAIGKFIGEMYEDSSTHADGSCPFVKRRPVKWLTEIDRYQFDPNLLLCLGNQQTMSSINSHSEYIDRKIAPLYTKGNESYLVLRVNQDKSLSWDDFCFIADLGDLFKAVSHESGINVDLTQIKMKINVQSPGDILMMCVGNYAYLLPIAFLILCALGGHVKLGIFEFETKGLGDFCQKILESVTTYLDHKAERKIRLEQRLKNMEIGVGESVPVTADESGRSEAPSSPEESEDGSAQTK